MKITLQDNEVAVLEKIRAMAGCKRVTVTVARLPDKTVFSLQEEGYDFSLVIQQANSLTMAFLSKYNGKTSSTKVDLSKGSATLLLTPGQYLADTKYLEADFVYGYRDSLVYTCDSLRVIACNLQPSASYLSYQARPIKALTTLIKSRKGTLSWSIDSSDNLNVVSDLGSLQIKPFGQVSPPELNTLSVLAESPIELIEEIKPAYSDKLLEAMVLVGKVAERIAVYKPTKKDEFIRLYTVTA